MPVTIDFTMSSSAGTVGTNDPSEQNSSSHGGDELKVNPAMQYKKDATLIDIFGPAVQPGRALLDEITRCYRVRNAQTLNVIML